MATADRGEPVIAARGQLPSRTVKVRRHPIDGGLGPRVRVRPWAFDRGVVQLALADQAIVPDRRRDPRLGRRADRPDRATADGLRRSAPARCSPTPPPASPTPASSSIDTLALLRIDLAGRAAGRRGAGTSPLRAAPPPRGRR